MVAADGWVCAVGQGPVTTNVRLDADVHRRLKHLAAAEGRSLSDVVREATAQYLARREGAVAPLAVEGDPFFQFLDAVAGKGADAPADLGRAHDRYLYGPAAPERIPSSRRHEPAAERSPGRLDR